MNFVPWVLALHTIAAVIWVGGMFFAHMALRPALAAISPQDRMKLWRQVFPRFFGWVWASVLTLLITGYAVIVWGYEGFGNLGPHINIMQATGLIMMALYAYLYFIPYQAFLRAADAGRAEDAQASLGPIRVIVSINLILGLFTSAIGATGGFWAY